MIEGQIFMERRDPEGLLYCVLKVLKISEKQVREIIEVEDDAEKWEEI